MEKKRKAKSTHMKLLLLLLLLLFIYLFIFFLLFRTTAKAYGGSQARGQMGATAACLRHSHNNAGSEPHL